MLKYTWYLARVELHKNQLLIKEVLHLKIGIRVGDKVTSVSPAARLALLIEILYQVKHVLRRAPTDDPVRRSHPLNMEFVQPNTARVFFCAKTCAVCGQ